MNGLKANLQKSSTGENSVPKPAQKYFFDAVINLWVQELRKYFQNATTQEKIDGYIRLSCQLTNVRFPNLKKAINEAANKDPAKPLKRLNNFGEGWDFSRFVYLVEMMETANSPFPNHKEVYEHLKLLRTDRNATAHDDYVSSEDREKSDDKLFEYISAARKYIPQINSLNEFGTKAAQIQRKLFELQGCLWQREDDVTILLRKITDLSRAS